VVELQLHINYVGANVERLKGGRVSFALYIIGFIVLIIGLAVGANMMHIPAQWMGVGVLILVGLGVVTGVTHTRQRDSSS
jgi:hypothetical protein